MKTAAFSAIATALLGFSEADGDVKSFKKHSRVFVPYGLGEGYDFGMGAVEQAMYDPAGRYMYCVSEQGFMNVIDYGDKKNPQVLPEMAVPLDGKATDIEVCSSKGLLIVGVGADDLVGPGTVRIYGTINRDNPQPPQVLREYKVGPLPDMVKPNHDCSMIAVGNEGEGSYDTGKLVDPEGSVHIIRMDKGEAVNVKFDPVATSDKELIAKGALRPHPGRVCPASVRPSVSPSVPHRGGPKYFPSDSREIARVLSSLEFLRQNRTVY